MITKALARNSNGGRPAAASLLNELFRPWNDLFPESTRKRTFTMPAVNVRESEKAYELSIAAPGLGKNDFDIDLQGRLLTVSAEKEESTEDKDKNYSRREYNYSSFRRSFTLPEEVDQNAIEAVYQDGVLKLRLPRKSRQESQR